MTRAFVLLPALALLLLASESVPPFSGSGARARRDSLHLHVPPHERSRSVNLPWQGHLMRGMRLPDSELVRQVDEYVEYGRFYGTWQLVQLVHRAADHVAQSHPGSQLSVGELSGPRGGRIVGHHSHRNGRDVDLAFYMRDETGAPATARTFVPLGKRGKGRFAGRAYHFDAERNWRLVEKLIDDPDARVQYIFVAEPLKRLLLAEAERVAAPRWLVGRAKVVLFEPREGNRHQSHFHLRIYCPKDDRPACRDRGPFYPWYDGVPPGGVYAALATVFPTMPDGRAQLP